MERDREKEGRVEIGKDGGSTGTRDRRQDTFRRMEKK